MKASTFPSHSNSVRPTRKIYRKLAQIFGEYSHGHEHIIDHPRRDIFVWRVWFLWARALVLNARHGVRIGLHF
jgi:hypothetical protein